MHLDIRGPYGIESITNARYFLTIVEDYCKTTWTFILAHKSQIYGVIRSFLAYVINHFKVCPKFEV